jgi:hypothetical protein
MDGRVLLLAASIFGPGAGGDRQAQSGQQRGSHRAHGNRLLSLSAGKLAGHATLQPIDEPRAVASSPVRAAD